MLLVLPPLLWRGVPMQIKLTLGWYISRSALQDLLRSLPLMRGWRLRKITPAPQLGDQIEEPTLEGRHM